jgi:signal transduction histidine kinase
MRWPPPRPHWAARTIRLRLTALYGVVFLITGAILLTLGYLLVRHNVGTHGDFRQALARLGVSRPGAGFFGHRPRFGQGSTEFRLVAAVAAQLRADALHRLLLEYILALMAMTAVSVVAGWLLAGRALRPLRQITATARRVSGENLGERIALSGPADELKELADTFDGMLTRLDNAFASQRHFVANASHELRTPLAIMRTELDVAMIDPDARIDDLRRMGEAVRETVDRCERLIEGLLMLARSEAAAGHEEPVDLAPLAADCLTDLQARAREREVRVRGELNPAWVYGEPALLERMIANLIDNGIRYNVPGGRLDVSTRIRAGRVSLTVANAGAPIDPRKAQRLMEPFERLDRATEGFGLGLSIVRSVVAAHNGTIAVHSPATGGLVVSVEFPAAPVPAKLMVAEESRALTAS